MVKKKNKTDSRADYVWGVLRITLGLTFLWAFIDKLLGLGFATCRDEAGVVTMACEKAVVSGGSSTLGFLKFGTTGPLSEMYQSLAGNWFIDLIFMTALLGLGIALTFGIGMRVAAVSGVALLLMMWSATLLPENNPLIDEHIVYAIAIVGLLLVNNTQKLGLGQWWTKTAMVKKYPFLT